MLLPDEASTLRQTEAGIGRRWLIVALVSLVAAVTPTVIALSTGTQWDHLLGRTKAVSATVESVQVTGHCGRDRKTEYRVTVSYNRDRGDYRRCGSAPQEGQAVRVWASAGGQVYPESPTTTRGGLGALSLTLALMVWLFGALVLIPLRRRRRRLLDSGGRLLAEPVLAEVVTAHKGQLRIGVRSHPSFPTSRRVRMYPVLYSRYGSPPTTRVGSAITGSWWLHLTPDTGTRRRPGLLVRGQERCWIDL